MDPEEPRDVRERLNTLILKKLYDQQERENKEVKSAEELQNAAVVVKQEVDYDTTEEKISTENSENEKAIPNGNSEHEHLFNNISLSEILNEKKKALLRDPQVVKFFQSKIKDSE